jgi:hypothetical protein
MADETFRPRRPQQSNNEQQNFPENQDVQMAEKIRQSIAKEEGQEVESPKQGNFNIQGNVPPEFLNALKNVKSSDDESELPSGLTNKQPRFRESQPQHLSAAGSSHLKDILANLKRSNTTYEEIVLPSKGKFYDGENGPKDGVLSIRPMTGEEEQILATPRLVRKGQAINMIFQKCIRENYRVENLLSIDRTYILIYLRGISYSPAYDVEIKCPECEKKFAYTIDLNSLYLESCPDEFGPILQDVLPTSKLPFVYRLATGKDEQDVQDHRDRRIKNFGDNSTDDTLLYRTALLLEEIDGIFNKSELQLLLKSLPINDLSHLRNCMNEPPFGVDTGVEIICPSCLHEFQIDLPLEANFFFPRRKKTRTEA